MKRWDLETLPFLPEDYKYECIPERNSMILYVHSEPGRHRYDLCVHRLRDGKIYLPAGGSGSPCDRKTEEESLDRFPDEGRGAQRSPGGQRPERVDNLASAAYLRAKEDYLMGINFSRVLTLKYGWTLGNFMKQKRSVVVAVGRVMTCVLGMIVKREREIRRVVPRPFIKCSPTLHRRV